MTDQTARQGEAPAAAKAPAAKPAHAKQATAAKKTAKKPAAKTGKAKPSAAIRPLKAVDTEEMFQFSKNNKRMESMMYQGKTQFDKYTQEATRAGKEHADALMESGTILMKGYEDLFKTWLNWAQGSAERSSEAVKELLGCRTLNELAETQSRLAQEGFDDFVAGATRVSELSVKLAADTFEPLGGQLNKNLRKAEKRAA
jgi:phasin family protein